MIKSELVARLAARHRHLYYRDAERMVAAVLNSIGKSLGEGHRVELRGFGAFKIVRRAGRIGRNPKTGEPIAIAEKNTVHFRLSADVRKRMNAQSD